MSNKEPRDNTPCGGYGKRPKGKNAYVKICLHNDQQDRGKMFLRFYRAKVSLAAVGGALLS